MHGSTARAATLAACLWAALAASAAAGCMPIRGINLPAVFHSFNVTADIASRWPFMSPRSRSEISAQLSALRKQGFNAVRVIIDPIPLLQPNRDLRFNSALRDFSDAAGKNGLCVIYSPGLPSWNKTYNEHAVFGDPGRRASYEQALVELPGIVGTNGTILEIQNEPTGHCDGSASDWPDIQEETYRKIRAISPDVEVIVTPVCWSSVDALTRFNVSPYRADPRVLFTTHYYEPAAFAEQAMQKICPFPELRAVPYPAGADCVERTEPPTIAAVQEQAMDQSAKETCIRRAGNILRTYCQGQGSRAYAEERFAAVAAWAVANGLAARRIFVGEFGAASRGPDGAGAAWDDRMRYLADVRSVLNADGFSWAVWSLNARFSLQCPGADPAAGLCPDAQNALGLPNSAR